MDTNLHSVTNIFLPKTDEKLSGELSQPAWRVQGSVALSLCTFMQKTETKLSPNLKCHCYKSNGVYFTFPTDLSSAQL